MLLKKYQQGFKLKKIFSFLCVFLCVTLCYSGVEANETMAYDKYFEIGLKLYRQKRSKEADNVFSIAINKYPNVAKLHFWRAKLRQNYLGKYRDAIRDYSIVIKLTPNGGFTPKSYYMRGLCRYKFELYALAIKDYNNCFRLNPNYYRAYFDRAKAYAKLGMIKKARNDLKATIKYLPDYTRAVKELWKKILEGSRDF